MSRNADGPRIFIPPPLIFVTALVAGLAIDGRLGGALPAPDPVRLIGGGVLTLVGVVLILGGLITFLAKGARAEPWRGGDVFVTSGIYRLTRNPMYLGLMLAYAGLALTMASPAAGLLLVPLFFIMDRLIIPREEAYLARRFGADYEAFRGRVRRWI